MSSGERKNDCISCMKPIDGQCLTCCDCDNGYHLGKCSGVTKAAFKAYSVIEQSSWNCPTCVVHRKRQTALETSGKTLPTNEELGKLLSDMNDKLASVVVKIESLEQAMSNQAIKNDAVLEKLDSQKRTVDAVERAMEMLSAKYDEALSTMSRQKQELDQLKKKTCEFEQSMKEKDATIAELRVNVSSLEQYSRRNNVEIRGLRTTPNEDLLKEINVLAGRLRLPEVAALDTESIHRLPVREGMVPPILIRFTHRSTRDLWLSKRTTLRNENIYVNENLTKHVKALFWKTKQLAREHSYKFVWTRNGKIFVRQKEGAAVIRIEHEEDLRKCFNGH